METIKKCSKCLTEKPIDDFGKHKKNKDGFRLNCKRCESEASKLWVINNPEKYKAYLLENREKRLESTRRWFEKHPEKAREYARRWRKKHSEKAKEAIRKWRENNKARFMANLKIWRSKNKWRRRLRDATIYATIRGCLDERMSANIRRSLGRSKHGAHWESLVGFTLEELKAHLESKFLPGMSWENRGKWHIDHIIPISFFRYQSSNDQEFRYCWSLDNLQPLWAKDNRCKSTKIPIILSCQH